MSREVACRLNVDAKNEKKNMNIANGFRTLDWCCGFLWNFQLIYRFLFELLSSNCVFNIETECFWDSRNRMVNSEFMYKNYTKKRSDWCRMCDLNWRRCQIVWTNVVWTMLCCPENELFFLILISIKTPKLFSRIWLNYDIHSIDFREKVKLFKCCISFDRLKFRQII